MFRRVVIIVLDGVGIGALPDAQRYGDQDAATLQHVAAAVGGLHLPQLEALGLGRIAPVHGVARVAAPAACWGKMAEQSAGKDSVTGHWEIAGVILDRPFAVFPDGFPAPIIAAFTAVAGSEPLGNLAASGTDVLRLLGEEHLRTGRPIVYTSSDSVFQIAAHEQVMAPAALYDLCRATFAALAPYNICRVIARPFLGDDAATFYRTAGRHDFPSAPPSPTLLDLLHRAGVTTCGIGKIEDLFAGQGLAMSTPTDGNRMGMAATLRAFAALSDGLIMTNLVDFDMLYGHRRDAAGFAAALTAFDNWLPTLLQELGSDDLLIVTADHGCDPTTPGTDHSREYVPLLAYSPGLHAPVDLGVRATFADLGATVAENFGVRCTHGQSFLADLQR
ncbi:MAG: phosphopentomutase [Pelovirga sp.]